MARMRTLLPASLLALPLAVQAVEPGPEIQRPPSAPQVVGAVHTLRTIPEACARLEGVFTGKPTEPYRFAAVRTSERCGPRARLVDAAQAKPSVQAGWILNDAIRVPDAACTARIAVLRIWRKPAAAAPPKLDAQGKSRIYLKEGTDAARQGQLGPVPLYSPVLSLEGTHCD